MEKREEGRKKGWRGTGDQNNGGMECMTLMVNARKTSGPIPTLVNSHLFSCPHVRPSCGLQETLNLTNALVSAFLPDHTIDSEV